jgi:restriction system protein
VASETQGRSNFQITLKAVSAERSEAEREYERSPQLFDFRIVNDRSPDWVERQLHAYLMLTGDASAESLYLRADTAESRQVIAAVADKLTLRLLAQTPSDLLKLSPRQFEELVAELLARDGYEVELTPQTRDGGFDIVAVKHADLIVPQLCLVECKLYSDVHRVGVRPVRQLFGVVSERDASAGLIVTSSSFTKPAIEFQQSVGNRLALRDYGVLKTWLARYQ